MLGVGIIWLLAFNNSLIINWLRNVTSTNYCYNYTFPISFKFIPTATTSHVSDQGNDQTCKIIYTTKTSIGFGGNQDRMSMNLIVIGF